MQSEIINIAWIDVSIATLFIIAAGVCSIYLKLGLERDLLVGTIRTFLQLALLGYVLRAVFSINDPLVVILLFSCMIFFAAKIISRRVKEKRVSYFLPVLASMFLSYMIINTFVMSIVIKVEPWYYPVYFIPIGGMIIGNSMNAISLSINTWFEGLKKERDRVELFLSLIAIKYQVIIMFILIGSTALSTVLALHIVRRLSFTKNHQLKM